MLSVPNRGLSLIARKLDHYSRGRILDEYLGRAGLGGAGSIHTFTAHQELRTLLELALACPDNAAVLEIGSYLGASACYLSAGLFGRNGKLYCVDTWTNETMPGGIHDTFGEFKKNLASVFSMIQPLRKHSSELTPRDVPSPLHLAFLDGDHSYQSTLADFHIVSPLMRDDGVIALHDTKSFPGVSKALGEILCEGKWRMAGHVENLSWLNRADWKES
jgi:predicted O-methyltransferase YrrM